MKRYKFQALVTIGTGDDGQPCSALSAAPRRMVLRGRDAGTGHSQIFNTLVSCDDEAPFRPRSDKFLVTLRLADNDVARYLEIGGHFDLWLGHDIGHGIVTRRLFT